MRAPWKMSFITPEPATQGVRSSPAGLSRLAPRRDAAPVVAAHPSIASRKISKSSLPH